MAMRPGDSAPKFDQIEQHLNPDADSPDQNSPPPEDAAAADLPDSHVFQMPAMVPHFSDGSTDVLERGRDHDEPDQDATEPLFPRQTPVPGDDGAADTVAQDDESTAELKRITAREMARLPAPDVADPSPGSEETVVTPAAEPALVTAAASRSRTPAASSATGTGSSS
ncbi:MAG: hypothetical protein KDA75_00660, partial [Planctomycetaceae bacterium]|nr:hypothetical protein [Planctomycetaceae bacterium]